MESTSPAGIERRLFRGVAWVVMAVLLPMGGLAAYRTIAKANELSDLRLRETALTLDALLRRTGVSGVLEQASAAPAIATEKGMVSPFETEVGYRITDMHGHVLLTTDNLLELPAALPQDDRIHSVMVRRRRWHVYTRIDPGLEVIVSVAERHDSRRDIMNAVALERTLPVLITLPLLLLALRWAIRRGLRPLDVLTRLLVAREPGSREIVALPETAPEIQPIVDSLNAQIGRIEGALERERRFSADVAHELRTPLAATMINLDSASAAASAEYSAIALPDAIASLRLLARRTDQLLILARLEDAASMPQERLDLSAVVRNVLGEWAPTVDTGAFHLETVLPDSPLWVDGHDAALSAMIRNLLENASRHVPRGGTVRISAAHDDADVVLDVMDNGPGIPPDRRDAVFARFHREASGLGDGFGVGLSIVQRVAQLHHARVSLEDAPWGSGLLVRTRLPRALQNERSRLA
ncbi:sensor histidine kinase N-terminal domain-containing protein [Luteibacter anthropi]|uniref:ATP-binding protein n=1 Tax=Luteibacter anthropi TaxID=564369 RepID=UPI002032528B|nr:ATP-binding protein [Luteibacter anthropi]URX61177.1 sensor histidine kinase N-terminal domain-containing protein [Luteibacter anthropi]